MNIILDTNTLSRLVNTADPLHDFSVKVNEKLLDDGHKLFIFPQALIEFRAISTRPIEANGLGFTHETSLYYIYELELLFPLLPETSSLYSHWLTLIEKYKVSGKQVHDARIAAFCIKHKVLNILTFNEKDFLRYGEINVINPKTILAP